LTKEEKNKIKRPKERKDFKNERKTKRRYFKIRRTTILIERRTLHTRNK
jgi:hypothetical protein